MTSVEVAEILQKMMHNRRLCYKVVSQFNTDIVIDRGSNKCRMIYYDDIPSRLVHSHYNNITEDFDTVTYYIRDPQFFDRLIKDLHQNKLNSDY